MGVCVCERDNSAKSRTRSRKNHFAGAGESKKVEAEGGKGMAFLFLLASSPFAPTPPPSKLWEFLHQSLGYPEISQSLGAAYWKLLSQLDACVPARAIQV